MKIYSPKALEYCPTNKTLVETTIIVRFYHEYNKEICFDSKSNRNLIECSLCLTMVHLKCNNLNAVDAEIIKNTDSEDFGHAWSVPTIYFLLLLWMIKTYIKL